MDTLPSDVFSRRLREERRKHGLDRDVLSRRISVLLAGPIDPTLVHPFEEHARAPRLDEAVAAAKALGVPILTLISDDTDRSYPEGSESESAS